MNPRNIPVRIQPHSHKLHNPLPTRSFTTTIPKPGMKWHTTFRKPKKHTPTLSSTFTPHQLSPSVKANLDRLEQFSSPHGRRLVFTLRKERQEAIQWYPELLNDEAWEKAWKETKVLKKPEGTRDLYWWTLVHKLQALEALSDSGGGSLEELEDRLRKREGWRRRCEGVIEEFMIAEKEKVEGTKRAVKAVGKVGGTVGIGIVDKGRAEAWKEWVKMYWKIVAMSILCSVIYEHYNRDDAAKIMEEAKKRMRERKRES